VFLVGENAHITLFKDFSLFFDLLRDCLGIGSSSLEGRAEEGKA